MTPDDKLAKLDRLLTQVPGPAIVYANTRRGTHEIVRHLQGKGIPSAAYHAGLPADERRRIERGFLSGEQRLMVATNAFGMGVDKPDVRLVVHFDVPGNLEAYYQEAGRAGRDGETSYAIALYSMTDLEKLSTKIQREFPPEKFIRRVYEALGNFFKLALGSGLARTFSFDLSAFARRYGLPVRETRHALAVLAYSGWIEINESGRESSQVHFLLSAESLYDFRFDTS